MVNSKYALYDIPNLMFNQALQELNITKWGNTRSRFSIPHNKGYFGYRVFHLFWPDVPVTLLDIHVGQYCFNPHNICQVWTCHQSTLQSIQSMKLYNQYVGTARYKILPIIRHCAPFCAHYFFFLRNMLFSHSFMHFCCDLLSLRFTHILPLFVAEKLLLAIVLLLL